MAKGCPGRVQTSRKNSKISLLFKRSFSLSKQLSIRSFLKLWRVGRSFRPADLVVWRSIWSKGSRIWSSGGPFGERVRGFGRLAVDLVKGFEDLVVWRSIWSKGSRIWSTGGPFGQRVRGFGRLAIDLVKGFEDFVVWRSIWSKGSGFRLPGSRPDEQKNP